MRKVGAAVAVVVAAVVAVFLTAASDEGGSAREYRIEFDNAFGLVEGGDFRVGGVRAGQTKKFEIVKHEGRAYAEVTAEITEPGFGELREDATCTIKPQSLIGEYYVDCQPGDGDRLGDKAVIPAAQTEATIPQDLVNDTLRRPYRERLRVIISTLGTGLAGRPEDISNVLRKSHPGLRETSKTLQILGRQNQVIENFVADADTVIAELEGNKRDVVRWVAETGRTAEISATRREDIRRSFQKLPRFLDELRPTMARLGDLAEEQAPLLADVQEAAPDLDRLIGNLGPFAEASRPALRALGDASETGTAAFKEGTQEVAELKALAKDAPPFAKPLRQYLQTLDDRARAIEDDPRAVVGSPPSPDPTAIPAGGSGGFTGMEALWNYFYWQSLSLNGFDDVSHILRVSAVISDCSEMETSASDEPDDPQIYKDCNSWLGPHQPGITAPDPTATGTPASTQQRAEAPARERGERRAPGEPDAGPLPGQPDISKPQVRLPQQVEDLLKQLTPNEQGQIPLVEDLLNAPPPSLPAPHGGQTPNELLDFLLGP